MAQVFSSPSFDGAQYKANRSKYPSALLDEILTQTAGRDLALDVGCGPGTFTFDLSPHFAHVVGIDPSESMLKHVKDEGNVVFRVGSADALPDVRDGSVDLIASGTAAHWFPSDWWREALRVLKPGGVVALFVYANPGTLPFTPYCEEINLALQNYYEALEPYATKGNHVANGLYDELCVPGQEGIPQTGWEPVCRKKWLVADLKEGEAPLIGGKLSSDRARKLLGTGSPVHTWRRMHPDVPPEEDIVERYLQQVQEATGWDENQEMEYAMDLALVTVKKSVS